MTNFEFYENEIKSRGFNFAVDKSNGELFCCGQEGSCDKCVFCPDTKELLKGRTKFVCSKINIVRWLYQKHKIKMNALEYGLLEYMLSEGYEWVSRDDADYGCIEEYCPYHSAENLIKYLKDEWEEY